jgi:hypothetical protein
VQRPQLEVTLRGHHTSWPPSSPASSRPALPAPSECAERGERGDQALAKSGKMVPVMVGGLLLGGRRFSAREYLQVAAIVGGTAVFNLAKVSARGCILPHKGSPRDALRGKPCNSRAKLTGESLKAETKTRCVETSLLTLQNPPTHTHTNKLCTHVDKSTR